MEVGIGGGVTTRVKGPRIVVDDLGGPFPSKMK